MKWVCAMLVILLLVLAAVLCVPFTLVWALNVLVGTHTPYSLESWLAAVFVIILVKISINYSRC
jgi:hypothetical protein